MFKHTGQSLADRADDLKMKLKDAGLWPGAGQGQKGRTQSQSTWSQKCLHCGELNQGIWGVNLEFPKECGNCHRGFE